MDRRFRPRAPVLVGAAAAALAGALLGAWIKPPPTSARDPDPYENLVITLPEQPSGSDYALADAAWVPPAPAAGPDSPDSRIDLATPDRDAGESAAWSLPWDGGSAAPDPAALARVDAVLPPPPDGPAAWPSASGDILAVDEGAAPRPPPHAGEPEPAQARDRDPRDWDLPASAYSRASQAEPPSRMAATATASAPARAS